MRAIFLNHSFGVITVLQQEVLSTYEYILKPETIGEREKRICNALTILRSIVSLRENADMIASCISYPFIEI